MSEKPKSQEELRQRPPTQEDEYFAKQDKARVEEARKKEEAKGLRELHYMHCPKCGMDLKEEVFREVAIDRCQQCGGVWLDKGELEKLALQEEGSLGRLIRSLFGG